MWGLRRTSDHSSPPAPVVVPPAEVTIERVPPSRAGRAWSDSLGLLAIRALQIIAVAALAAGVLWGLNRLSIVVIPVLLALILASALAPVMRFLRRRRVPAMLAALATLLAALALLGGLGWAITVAVQHQWPQLQQQATQGFNELVAWARGLDLGITIDQQRIDSVVSTITDFVTSARFGSGALAGVSAVFTLLASLVLTIVVLFFFLKDGPLLWEFALRPFTGASEQRARRIGAKVVDTLGAYFRGTATVAAVDAIGIGAGLALAGVPLALPLATLVYLLAFIPIVGATLAGILAALVALVAKGPLIAVVVVLIVIGINQLEGNLLQPVLMGRSLQLHSLAILIALTIGTAVGGILGAVMAVPITAVAWGVIKVWDGPDLPAIWARPSEAVDEG